MSSQGTYHNDAAVKGCLCLGASAFATFSFVLNIILCFGGTICAWSLDNPQVYYAAAAFIIAMFITTSIQAATAGLCQCVGNCSGLTGWGWGVFITALTFLVACVVYGLTACAFDPQCNEARTFATVSIWLFLVANGIFVCKTIQELKNLPPVNDPGYI